MLVKRLSDALRNAAMLLTVDDHRIQHLPEIINHVDRDLTCLRVDLDLDRMRAVRMFRSKFGLGCDVFSRLETSPSGHKCEVPECLLSRRRWSDSGRDAHIV
jgi:hypothetical protein